VIGNRLGITPADAAYEGRGLIFFSPGSEPSPRAGTGAEADFGARFDLPTHKPSECSAIPVLAMGAYKSLRLAGHS